MKIFLESIQERLPVMINDFRYREQESERAVAELHVLKGGVGELIDHLAELGQRSVDVLGLHVALTD
jgi:hypothetical protein